ncbi:VOC family protein [Vaginisenegalia massiliensis]|uniref:VOC family protein n=1 Tax=Vaginisenegalia massiliensis TaxID=2058294 RepID=UPI000F52B8F2|nr:VOC family protein [Vaginisenegalia massiliensis]
MKLNFVLPRLKLFLVLFVSLILGAAVLAKTSYAQTSPSQTHLEPASYQLNALKPKQLADFYHQSLGLSLLDSRTEKNYYRLGTPEGKVLLEIFPAKLEHRNTTGLYHTAFLFASEKDLMNAYARMMRAGGGRLQGTADHGVSQAIYFADPEGNGIELYHDKDPNVWPRDTAGNITMGNQPYDISRFLKQADPAYEAIPNSGKIGHFHLAVADIQATRAFYEGLLGFGVTSSENIDSLFMASGSYHHHLGANTWETLGATGPQADQQGLRRVIWHTSDSQDLSLIKDRLKQAGHPFQDHGQQLDLIDNSGIPIQIRLEK